MGEEKKSKFLFILLTCDIAELQDVHYSKPVFKGHFDERTLSQTSVPPIVPLFTCSEGVNSPFTLSFSLNTIFDLFLFISPSFLIASLLDVSGGCTQVYI